MALSPGLHIFSVSVRLILQREGEQELAPPIEITYSPHAPTTVQPWPALSQKMCWTIADMADLSEMAKVVEAAAQAIEKALQTIAPRPEA